MVPDNRNTSLLCTGRSIANEPDALLRRVSIVATRAATKFLSPGHRPPLVA